MRLINASTLKLVDKREDDLPFYAILSHTWDGDENEVSFEDMRSFNASSARNPLLTHPATRKAGFAKLEKSARLAISQGLQYVWVDTCCIDKSSSAELSEAINSMFRWYQNAAVCYAFLSDVSLDAGFEDAPPIYGFQRTQYIKYIESIRSSRWFTRGWTLQELIAPRTVQFYMKDWLFLGEKNDAFGFQSLVNSITRIPTAVLDRSRSLSDVGIAERMQWASDRITTRLEDQAYSLMGLFDINMPLLYGEGKKAFIRLQEEILKTSGDQSLFAWTSLDNKSEPGTRLTGLLAASPVCFRNTGHIVPFPPDSSSPSEPSTMTNIGLQITLNLAPNILGEPGEFDAVLDCEFHESGDMFASPISRPAIRLMALGGNQYARIQSQSIFEISASIVDSANCSGRSRIFVKQQPVPLMPDIVLQGLEGVNAHNGQLMSVWPHGQWDASQQTIRPRGAPRDGIIAAFRFQFDTRTGSQQDLMPELRSQSDLVTLDLFVGYLQNTNNPASSTTSAWCSSFSSDEQLPLPNVPPSALTHILGTSGRRSPEYDIELSPSIKFNVECTFKREISIIKLETTMVHELPEVSMSSSSATKMDPMVAKYEHIAQELTIQDAARISLSNQYSSFYEIRVGRADGSHHCREELDRIQHCIKSTLTDVAVLRPDQTAPDLFEAHFSKLLVKACIANDIRGAQELLESRLSTALVDVWTSEVHTSHGDIDRLNILRGFRPLHWVALFGHEDLAPVLLDNGANPFLETWVGLTPLHVALAMGHITIVKQMCDAIITKKIAASEGTSVCDTLLNFAASFIRKMEVGSVLDALAATRELDHLQAASGYPNALGENVLHRAAAMDSAHAARWAVTWKVDLVNSRDKRGRTPLFHAAAAGSVEVCRILLENDADAGLADGFGRIPLCVACHHGHRPVVEMLLHLSGSWNERKTSNNCSRSLFGAWHFAALSGDVGILKLLDTYSHDSSTSTEYAMKLEFEDHNVITPLHIASSVGSRDCVKHLVHTSSNITARTKFAFVPATIGSSKPQIETAAAMTAEEWARARGFDEIATILRDLIEDQSETQESLHESRPKSRKGS